MWKGIDVSDNQGIIDWGQVKNAGCEFAIMRSVRRSGKVDGQFEANVAGCRKYNIPISVYKYTYAVTEAEAANEANQVIDLLKKCGLKCVVWWDVEDRDTLAKLGKDKLTACIKAAQNVIVSAGYKFGIYTGLYVYREKWFDFDQFSCPFWIARYPETSVKTLGTSPNEKYLPDVGRTIWGWQYSSNGSVHGITTAVDLDVCYEDPTQCLIETEGVHYMLMVNNINYEDMKVVQKTLAGMNLDSSVYTKMD